MNIIEYKGKEYKFKDNLNFKQIRAIVDKYEKELKLPVAHWWYKKTDFGAFMLKNLCSSLSLPDIPEEDWVHFIPALKSYFITYKEFGNIVHNAIYLQGAKKFPKEDTNFMSFILIKEFCKLTYKEILSLPYKRAIVLYVYSVARNMISSGLNPLNLDMESMFR